MNTRSKSRVDNAPEQNTSSTSGRRASLDSLPAELIFIIASHLDVVSWYRLARAWRSFLHTFACALDPWNPVRKRLRDLDDRHAMARVFALRFAKISACPECTSRHKASCDCGWEFEKWLMPKPALFKALIEYMRLDVYRTRGKPPLRMQLKCPEMLRALVTGCSLLDRGSATPTTSLPLQVHFCHVAQWNRCECCGVRHGLCLARISRALRCHSLCFTVLHIGSKETHFSNRATQSDLEGFCEALRANVSLRSLEMEHWPSESDAHYTASIIEAVADHPVLSELFVPLWGSRCVAALADLLENGAVKLKTVEAHQKTTFPHIHGLEPQYMVELGAAVAANKTLETIVLFDFMYIDQLAAFVNAFLSADRSCSVLRRISIRMTYDNAVWYTEYGEEDAFALIRDVEEKTQGRVSLYFFDTPYTAYDDTINDGGIDGWNW